MSPLRGAVTGVGLPRPVVLIGAAVIGLMPALGAVPAAPTDAETIAVRFLEPGPSALILGTTRITVEAEASSGARIVSVAIYVDDSLLTILERPPYTLNWDAGTRFVPRSLRAVATDSAGRSGEARLAVRPLHVGQYEEVRLVTLYASVRDRRGHPVLDLSPDDFALLEDGVPQTLSHFSSARVPLTVSLLIDASNSMGLGGKLALACRAAEDFVEAVDPEDRLLVLHFNDGLHGHTEPAADRRRLKEDLATLQAGGGTALYDAVFRTAELLQGREGRRAIVLLSDGRDQALTDNEPGSLHLFEEALRMAHRAEAAVYAIGLGRHLETELDLQGARSLKEILSTLAAQTGGRSYFPARAGELSGIYRQIAADLKQQFALAYTSTNRERDGRWRSIALRVRRPDLEVRTRAGYYAPGPDSP